MFSIPSYDPINAANETTRGYRVIKANRRCIISQMIYRSYSNGTTPVVFEAPKFLARLAAVEPVPQVRGAGSGR